MISRLFSIVTLLIKWSGSHQDSDMLCNMLTQDIVITRCFIFSCHFQFWDYPSGFGVPCFIIPIMWSRKSLFRISCSGFTIADYVFQVLPFRILCYDIPCSSVLGFPTYRTSSSTPRQAVIVSNSLKDCINNASLISILL